MPDTQDTQPDVPEKPKRKISDAELDTVKNYIILEFGYDMHICLPHKEGVALMACMEHAEKVKLEGYSTKTLKFGTETIQIASTIITQKVYRTAKMNQLLGVDNE